MAGSGARELLAMLGSLGGSNSGGGWQLWWLKEAEN